MYFFFFFFNDTATTEIYTLSLHDALPISWLRRGSPTAILAVGTALAAGAAVLASRRHVREDDTEDGTARSEEHTSELQSPCNLVCRLLLEKKKMKQSNASATDCNNAHTAA